MFWNDFDGPGSVFFLATVLNLLQKIHEINMGLYKNSQRKDIVQAYCRSDPLVMSVAVFLGIVGPGPKPFWVEGINLHEKLWNREKR